MSLQGMTQQRWDRLSSAERDRLRSDAGLTPQLIGLEGWRVEVVYKYGDKRRFIVSRSTGWVPCHIELKGRASSGGMAVMGAPFQSIRKLYKVYPPVGAR